MTTFRIPGGERSPEVDFDFAAGRLSLRGESYPEDASQLFGPIFSALEGFLANAVGRDVAFDFELIYFNSSSAKALMNMFHTLDQAAAQGVNITVNWKFADGDETMMEFGEDYSEDLTHLTFNLVAMSPA